MDRVDTADLDAWRWMYDVNVLGLVRVTKALLPTLRASGDGVVVNVGSTAGRDDRSSSRRCRPASPARKPYAPGPAMRTTTR